MNLLFRNKKITITSSVYLFLLISVTWQSAIPVSAKENNTNYHNHKPFPKQTQFSERINKKIEPLELRNTLILASKVERKSTSEPQEPDIALFSLIILGSVVFVWQKKNNLHEIVSTQVSRAISYYLLGDREQTKKLQQQIDILNSSLIALSKQHTDNESKHKELKENQKYLSERIKDVYLQLNTLGQSKNYLEDLQSKYTKLSESLDYIQNLGIDFRIAIRQYNHEKQAISEELFEKIDNLKQEYGYMLEQLTDKNYALESKLSQIDITITKISEKADNEKQAKSEELFEKIDNLKQEYGCMLEQLTDKNYALESKLSQIDITIEKISEKVDNEKQAKSEELFEKIDNLKQEYDCMLDQLTDENYTLESKLSQIDITIERISEKVDNCNSIIASTISKKCPGISNHSTVLRVLEKVDRDFRILRIYNSARNSAKTANFNNYDRLYLAFKAIAEIGARYFDASHEFISLGNNIENEFRRRNFSNNYRPTESESTINKYGNQRIFSHGDESKQVFRHLTFSASEHCLQIYFDFNKDRRTVDICYCGSHLPIASRSN